MFRKFHVQQGDKQSEERFSHGYFQGLLVEIGKYSHHMTYVPAQDKSKVFLDYRLEDITDMIQLPSFTHKDLLRRAKTIDVIWFNERMMPSSFYEVEHTTDIKNSLTKYYELQDFNAGFFIVANSSRRKEYEDKLHVSMFAPIEKRVKFIEYEKVVQMYEGLNKVSKASW